MAIQSISSNTQLLRLPAVIERTGLSRSTIYRKQAEGSFPRAVRISDHAMAWVSSDIDSWISERVMASREEVRDANS